MPVKFNTGGGVAASKDTATAADVRYGKTFHAGKGGNAKTGTMPDCAVKKVSPGKSSQTISPGSFIAETITISGDANLVSGNIRSGAEIFGVNGDSNVVDTSDGNLAAAGMLSGQKGYSQGKAVEGSIKTLENDDFSPSDSSAYNDCAITGAATNNYAGAFDYSVIGYIAGKIRIYIANLLAKNIRSGVKIGGIGGSILGTFTADATAEAGHVLKDKTFGRNGEMIKGTMANAAAIDPAKSVTVSDNVMYVRMTNGAHITNSTGGYPEVSIPCGTLTNKTQCKFLQAYANESNVGPVEESFTMPSDGYVCFDELFFRTSSTNRTSILAEVYVGGTKIDGISSEQSTTWEYSDSGGTHTAKKGDVIKVKAKAKSSGGCAVYAQAYAVYYSD